MGAFRWPAVSKLETISLTTSLTRQKTELNLLDIAGTELVGGQHTVEIKRDITMGFQD